MSPKQLSISSGSNSYNVAVDIKTESGTSTTSYYDAITQRTVDYTVSAFVVQGQPIINNAPDLSAAMSAGVVQGQPLIQQCTRSLRCTVSWKCILKRVGDAAQSVTQLDFLRASVWVS
jgi:hypothetical protein